MFIKSSAFASTTSSSLHMVVSLFAVAVAGRLLSNASSSSSISQSNVIEHSFLLTDLFIMGYLGALCIFGEIQKQVGLKPEFRPKPHLYLSIMRAFAFRGDYQLVKNLHKRIFPDTIGTILPVAQEEADHLLMEAALNAGQVDVAIKTLTYIVLRWKGISWTSHGGMVASRIEALLGFSASLFNPFLLPEAFMLLFIYSQFTNVLS